MQRTENGTPYYVDHVTKRTSWDAPTVAVVQEERRDICESCPPSMPSSIPQCGEVRAHDAPLVLWIIMGCR